MDVGINYPWFFNLYGWDFGPDPTGKPRAPRPIWETTLARNLDVLVEMGVKVVRSWILGNGFSYGAPRIVRPRRVWLRSVATFEPPARLDPLFTDHFRIYLEKFREKRLQTIPSLVSHGFFEATGGAWGNRQDVANDPRKREQFLDTVLGALLQESKGFEEQVYAWEVANEPYYNTTCLSPVGYTVPKDPMIQFLKGALQRIEAAGFPSTVGHRFYDDLRTFPTGSKPQFHYYAKWLGSPFHHSDPRRIPPYAESKAFIGEFNGSDEQSWQWPDLDGRDHYERTTAAERTLRRLQLLESRGYPLAILWPDGGDPSGPDPALEDDLKYSRSVCQGIIDYTRGRCSF
jgi:hypothetical protein